MADDYDTDLSHGELIWLQCLNGCILTLVTICLLFTCYNIYRYLIL